MTKYILVRADTNDADYIEELNSISDAHESRLIDILSKIKKDDGEISWRTGDMASEDLMEQHPELTEGEIDLLDQYTPHGEYGVHTIDSIEIYEVINVRTLL